MSMSVGFMSCLLVIFCEIDESETHNCSAGKAEYGASGNRRAGDDGGDRQNIEAKRGQDQRG